jgi:hydrogenase-1 operon protein HyaF
LLRLAFDHPAIPEREIEMSVENAKSTFARSGSKSHPVFWMHQSKPVLSANAEPGASAQAILSEIEECVSRFAAGGEGVSIDLRCLKSMPEEREMLAALLGHGEVSATIDASGRSELYETSVPCVWWVRHRNSEDEIVGEMIEIAEVPEVMLGDRKAVASGLEALCIAWSFRMQRAPVVTTNHNER